MTARSWLGPGATATSRAVAWPSSVLFTNILTSMNGTVAEYSVGLVTLTLAAMVSAVLEVSRISRLPTLGEKVVFPPEMAGRTIYQFPVILELPYRKESDH